MNYGYDNRPIGVFDSGIGGLTVWRELRHGLPNESLIYWGDGLHCPFGPKPQELVQQYVDDAVRFFIERDVKMVVVACNAATAAAIDYLRAKYTIQFVGMEPAVKPAALASKSGIIGILATAATLQGRLYRDTATRYEERVQIISAVGEGFVELVEANRESTQEALQTVRCVIGPMLDAGADHIVLGCTHYPFLADAMREVIGERDVMIIDPAPAVQRRVDQLLKSDNIEASNDNIPLYEFFTVADDTYLQMLIKKSTFVQY